MYSQQLSNITSATCPNKWTIQMGSPVTVTSAYHSLYAQALELYGSVALDVCSQVLLLFIRKSIFQCPPYCNTAQYINKSLTSITLKCEARTDHSIQPWAVRVVLNFYIFINDIHFINKQSQWQA